MATSNQKNRRVDVYGTPLMNQGLLTRLDTLEKSRDIVSTIHVYQQANCLTINAEMEDDKRLYIPNKTGDAFHEDDSFVRLIMGPYGSGKSTICCAEIVKRTLEMPAWCNGIRRSKWAIVRNTSGELMTTTLQTWLHWFEALGGYTKRQKPVMTYEHTFRDKYGICEIELIFLALDREQDLPKIRSLEVTGVYINEACEVPQGAISHFKGRLRYPSQQLCDNHWSGIIADTNPPDKDHWIYKLFEKDKPNGYRMFKQPPGLLSINAHERKEDIASIQTHSGYFITNKEADNYQHLRPDYYLRMAEGENEEFIKVFCQGQYGAVIMGKRVYTEYNDDFHSAEDMQYAGGIPIDLSWDFGLTPACLISQFLPRGQLRFMKEFIAEDMGIKQFAESVVLPYIRNELKGFTVGNSIGDPAGAARSQSDESTCMDILDGLGIPTEAAKTNSLVPRLEAMKYFLNRVIDGQAALLVSREGCPSFRKGFLGNYHFRRIPLMGEERYHDIPNKNSASHPHDAAQYMAMHYGTDAIKNKKERDVSKLVKSITNRAFVL